MTTLAASQQTALIGIGLGLGAVLILAVVVRRTRRILVAVLITLLVTGGAWLAQGQGLLSTARGLLP